MNLAHLLDTGAAYLFHKESVAEDPSEEAKVMNKFYAQRFYEMSAEQGSASSELRLGDYAFYGWGLAVDVREEVEDEIYNSEEDELRAIELDSEVTHVRQQV